MNLEFPIFSAIFLFVGSLRTASVQPAAEPQEEAQISASPDQALTSKEMNNGNDFVARHGSRSSLKLFPGERFLYIAFCAAMATYSFMLVRRAAVRFHGILSTKLSPGIFPPYLSEFDQTDAQWRTFSSEIIRIAPMMLFFVFISRRVRSSRPQMLPHFYAASGIAFLYFLHGPAFLFLFVLLMINYAIALTHRFLPYPVYMLLIWTSQIGVLFLNDHFKGYSFAAFSRSLAWLDDDGLLKWYVIFNTMTLRMISFNCDWWESWKCGEETRTAVVKKHQTTCLECAMHGGPCYKLRTAAPSQLKDFSIVNYLAYTLYLPLYVAGPISSFNSFVSHLSAPQQWFGAKQAITYALRIVNMIVIQTVVLHFLHLNAMRAFPHLFGLMTTGEKVSLFWWTFSFLWLKFSVIWKFSRLIALLDGVEVPEDMVSCASNTVSIINFWKDWHASFNLWLVRYMYIPMGGAKRQLLAIFPIFAFVALWHDIQLNLFLWAFVLCIWFIPEALAQKFFSRRRWDWLRQKRYWRHLRALGCTTSCVFLVASNSIGFGVGTDSTSRGFSQIFSMENVVTCILSVGLCFGTASQGIIQRDLAQEERSRLKNVYKISSVTED